MQIKNQQLELDVEQQTGSKFSKEYVKAIPSKERRCQIVQVRLQQYVNREIPDVQAGFRKSRGTRNQIANICWIIEKAR